MKHAMTAQTNVCEDLRVVTTDMNQRLREIEQQEPDKLDMTPRVNEEAQSREMEAHTSSTRDQPGVDITRLDSPRIRKEAVERTVRLSGASAFDAAATEEISEGGAET